MELHSAPGSALWIHRWLTVKRLEGRVQEIRRPTTA
jgi:hypothetical protein